jgi:hypothetical protein
MQMVVKFVTVKIVCGLELVPSDRRGGMLIVVIV